jgi:splicing factor 3B subunit 3
MYVLEVYLSIVLIMVIVPGGTDGPGGVLVCSENYLTWKNQNYPEVKLPIPRRQSAYDIPDRGLLVVNYIVHRMKNMFFILIQNEFGDLYKLSVDYENDVVKELRIRYFDTISPSTSLHVFKSGFLFSISEFGNQ